MSLVDVSQGTRTTMFPSVYAAVAVPGSPEHEQARHLQAERFSHVSMGRGEIGSAFVQTTDYNPQRTIPLVVRRTSTRRTDELIRDETLLGTARLELPGATLIESMIRLRPDSTGARALASGRTAEIGGFASQYDMDKFTLLEVIDALVAQIVRIASRAHIDWLWIFPRNGFMSLLLAEIPGMLPKYRFKLSPDVLEWNEESEQLHHFRSLRMKGFGKYPDIFQIPLDLFEADLAARQKLRPRRYEYRHALDRLLTRAMVQAQREITKEAQRMRAASEGPLGHEQGERSKPARSVVATDLHAFLPFEGAAGDQAEYLHDVIRHGGNSAEAYKQTSYRLLELERGMRVLDVGCGAGVDLPALADQVGPYGAVIGVDHNPALVVDARQAVAANKMFNTWVYEGDAQELTFSDGEFDRVRADRTLQHVQNPSRAIGQMWRVLRPGGILTLIEPDWAAMVLYPAGLTGANDDGPFLRILQWCRQHLAHPLIGRQLRALLAEIGVGTRMEMRVTAQAYVFTDWVAIDKVLKLSDAATKLRQEDLTAAPEVEAWLHAVEVSARHGTFFAMVPLFFAWARKER